MGINSGARLTAAQWQRVLITPQALIVIPIAAGLAGRGSAIRGALLIVAAYWVSSWSDLYQAWRLDQIRRRHPTAVLRSTPSGFH